MNSIHPIVLALFAVAAPVIPVGAQIPRDHLVISMTSNSSAGLWGGLAVLDPVGGQVQRVSWLLGVIIDFQDVLVEPGTGHLFVAGASSGQLARSVEYWQLNGLAQASGRRLHTFTEDVIGMCHGPGGELYVLSGNNASLVAGRLWRVDRSGIAPPVQVDTWTANDGFPRGVCSDGSDLYVVCAPSTPGAPLTLWRVPPGGGKSQPPAAARPPQGVPTDIDHATCGDKLWISLEGGDTLHFALSGGVYSLHSSLGSGATAANHVPAAGTAFFVGRDPTSPQPSVVVTRMGAGGTQRLAIAGAGVPTGLHSDESSASYHGAFANFPVGYSCSGSSGRQLRIDPRNGPPDLGNQSFALELYPTVVGQAGVLIIGMSDQVWGAIPLPFDLSTLGAPPGCALLVSLDVQLGIGLVAVPTIVPAPIPCDLSLRGGGAFLQLMALDPGIAPLPVITSSGAAVVLR